MNRRTDGVVQVDVYTEKINNDCACFLGCFLSATASRSAGRYFINYSLIKLLRRVNQWKSERLHGISALPRT
jgi:hypothetical protein